MTQKIILGIDPGSVALGCGVITSENRKIKYVAHRCIKVKGNSLPVKLGYIYAAITEVLEEFSPQEVAIETVFVSKNAQSALKLGQARGAAICAAVNRDLPVSEYAPRLIKQSAVGHGGADKLQVRKMMQVTFSLESLPQSDAADGLAIAVCHANYSSAQNALGMKVPLTRRRKAKRQRAI